MKIHFSCYSLELSYNKGLSKKRTSKNLSISGKVSNKIIRVFVAKKIDSHHEIPAGVYLEHSRKAGMTNLKAERSKSLTI